MIQAIAMLNKISLLKRIKNFLKAGLPLNRHHRLAQTLCPSSLPELPNSQIFGVVEGTVTAPKVTYLPVSMPVTPALLAAASPVDPTEVFRIAAPCIAGGCQHLSHGQCQLAQRMVTRLPEVTKSLPDCSIRPDCRWWQQEGKAACLRCPQLVRSNYEASPTLRQFMAAQ